MKKTVIVSALGLATGGLLSAQGLYNIMPFDDEPTDSLPLNWTVGANIGWDSNASPHFSETPGADTDDVLYVSGFVQANWVNKTPQTTLDIWGRVGATYYLDNVDQSGGATGTRVESDFYPQFRGGVNIVHRVNECLRLRSRSHATWEQEPDYDYGISPDRRQGSYLRFSSDNSAGYRWTERLATNTGYRISGLIFDEVDGEDYMRHLFYNQFRYRTAPTTVWTASYRVQLQQNDSATDSHAHYFLVGAEHELGPVTVFVLRGGAQYFKPESGSDSWSPYIEAMIRTALSEAASVRAFARYGIEDRNRRIATHDVPGLLSLGHYDTRRTFRVGAQGSYIVSPKVTVFAGGHVVLINYDDVDLARSSKATVTTAVPPGDFSEAILNLNIGASVEVYENIYVTTSYNFTNSSSDSNIREYDRHRVQLGVQAAF